MGASSTLPVARYLRPCTKLYSITPSTQVCQQTTAQKQQVCICLYRSRCKYVRRSGKTDTLRPPRESAAGMVVLTSNTHSTIHVCWTCVAKQNSHVGLLLRICQGQRNTPRASKQQPFLYFKLFAELLIVMYEGLCSVVMQAAQGARCATATLIHQHNPPVLRIKKTSATQVSQPVPYLQLVYASNLLLLLSIAITHQQEHEVKQNVTQRCSIWA